MAETWNDLSRQGLPRSGLTGQALVGCHSMNLHFAFCDQGRMHPLNVRSRPTGVGNGRSGFTFERISHTLLPATNVKAAGMEIESPVWLAVIRLMALAVAVVFHEVAHGFVAWRLGDPTARQLERLTLNPFAHVDVVGSIILPLTLIFTGSPVLLGWAKPVPVNPSFFRNPRKALMFVAFAGPATNLLLALASGLLFRLVMAMGAGVMAELILLGLVYLCITNVVLGVFNLIPIPPLDGSKIVMGMLPESLARSYAELERFGFLLIFGLLYLGALDYLIRPAAGLLMRLFLGPL